MNVSKWVVVAVAVILLLAIGRMFQNYSNDVATGRWDSYVGQHETNAY